MSLRPYVRQELLALIGYQPDATGQRWLDFTEQQRQHCGLVNSGDPSQRIPRHAVLQDLRNIHDMVTAVDLESVHLLHPATVKDLKARLRVPSFSTAVFKVDRKDRPVAVKVISIAPPSPEKPSVHHLPTSDPTSKGLEVSPFFGYFLQNVSE